jgi:hypothetical protein
MKKSFGQATVEYLLLVALVVGLLLSVYQSRVKTLVRNFTDRKTQYTDVVQQKNLGIPLAWFGGKYGNIGGNTAGGVNSGAGSRSNSGDANQGDGSLNGGQTDGALNSGNTAGSPKDKAKGADAGGGDTSGEGDTAGGGRSGAPGSPQNLALNNSKNGKNNSRAKSSGQGDDGIEGSDSEDGSGGRGRRKVNTAIRSEGSLGDDAKEKSKKADDSQEAKEKGKNKEKQGDEELQKQKELYGSNKESGGKGGCSKVDLSALIKIALIVGLLFVLFGMLLQKKGDGQD